MAKKPIKNKYQTRAFPLRDIKLETRSDSDELPKITGRAAVFDTWSENLGYYKEKIQPGAFNKTIKENDIRALFNHDANIILGRNKAGTLKLEEGEDGLDIEISPPDTQQARDLITSVKRGDISQMSFAFQAIKDIWQDNSTKRILTEVKLFDVSLVTFPAYPQTQVSARSKALDEAKRDRIQLRLKNLRHSNPVYQRLQKLKTRGFI